MARVVHGSMKKRSEICSFDFSSGKEEGHDKLCECECGGGCSESLSHFAFTMEMDGGEGDGSSGGSYAGSTDDPCAPVACRAVPLL